MAKLSVEFDAATDLTSVQTLYREARRVAALTGDTALQAAVDAIVAEAEEASCPEALDAIERAEEWLIDMLGSNAEDIDLDRRAYDNETDGWWVGAFIWLPYNHEFREARDDEDEDEDLDGTDVGGPAAV